MAKTQNLSLNPTKISGTCGRLMCCLKYEQAAYEDLMKDAPRMDSFVETPDGAGTIISVNTLREKVRVRLDSAPDTLKTYHNSEIRVVRSGKGKRPEGYVEPPKQELAKLRKFSESPEDQARREQEALAACPNVILHPGTLLAGLSGGEQLEALALEDRATGRWQELPCQGLFAAIGRIPETVLLQGQVKLDSQGYVLAGESTQTNLPGVYAAGDIRTKPLRQIVTAAADGATAAHLAARYLGDSASPET